MAITTQLVGKLGGGLEWETTVVPSKAYTYSGAANGRYDLLTESVPAGKCVLIVMQAQFTTAPSYSYCAVQGLTAAGATTVEQITDGTSAPATVRIAAAVMVNPTVRVSITAPYNSSCTAQVTIRKALIDIPS
jgi:putative hemolysin